MASLIGRYIKAKIDQPANIKDANKGDYFKIIGRDNARLLKDRSTGWSIYAGQGELFEQQFELMPEWFNPELKEQFYEIY